MINCSDFFNALIAHDISFFTGVPDSLLKDFCAYITEYATPDRHVIAANEGNSIGLAAGWYLATGKPGLVYMQNSGLGNAVNPLTSLVDPDVYNIPILLVIGWRGEPGTKDEPQHVKQGKITLPMLETLGIEYCVMPDQSQDMLSCMDTAVNQMLATSSPYALIVRKGTFGTYALKTQVQSQYEMSREEVLSYFADWLRSADVVVSTTGKTSRELFENRASFGKETAGQYFLTVGSMGHASQIALGIALAQPSRQVYCLDGDGALIMHMGALAIVGGKKPGNLKHIIINNGTHDSVGGQPTVGFEIDIPTIAHACGYTTTLQVEMRDNLIANLDKLRETHGPALLEIRVDKGARSDLGRPTTTPAENKKNFMEFLRR